jgi:hypothetical protein
VLLYGLNSKQWADKLEKIASAIATTVYEHDLAMGKYNRDRKVTWDDADYLRILAKELRGKDGQLAHELGRSIMPWKKDADLCPNCGHHLHLLKPCMWRFGAGWNESSCLCRETDQDNICQICGNTIVKDAHGGPHPSAGDHDPAPHVSRAYGPR